MGGDHHAGQRAGQVSLVISIMIRLIKDVDHCRWPLLWWSWKIWNNLQVREHKSVVIAGGEKIVGGGGKPHTPHLPTVHLAICEFSKSPPVNAQVIILMSPHYASGQISQTCFLLNTCFSTFPVKILMSLHHEHGQEYHQHIFFDRFLLLLHKFTLNDCTDRPPRMS